MDEHRLREVDPPTMKAWLDRGEALLVDVREEDEHAREHIAGATSHQGMAEPLDAWPSTRQRLATRGTLR